MSNLASDNAPIVPTVGQIDFDVHPHIINDILHSQSGTLATAFRELVLNAWGAGEFNGDRNWAAFTAFRVTVERYLVEP